LVTGDWNHDGREDLATANGGAGSASVLLGTGTGSFAAHVDYATGAAPRGIAAADYNEDGHLDLAVANGTARTISVLLGVGDGTFTAGDALPSAQAPNAIAAGDVDGDGHADLLNATGAKSASLFRGRGDGTFDSRIDFGVGAGADGITCAFFDADSRLDVAVVNFQANSVTVLLDGGVTSDVETSAVRPDPGLRAEPNPFVGAASVLFRMARGAQVDLAILDPSGRCIRRLGVDSNAGWNEVGWDGRTDSGEEAPGGIYFVRLGSVSVKSARLIKLR
jgi:hypothetical protein